MIDVANGLNYMHGEGNENPVLHRDIKSSNIGLKRDSNRDYEAKILDYGIAKTNLKSYESDTLMTNTIVGDHRGTQGVHGSRKIYMEGKRRSKCDIFSFGVVFLELLTKQRASAVRKND